MKPALTRTMLVLALLAGSRLSATAAGPNADQILHQMSAKLAGARTFTFEAQRETDPALLEGRDVPEKARVSIAVRRPNQFAARGVSSGGARQFIADGRTLTIFNEKKNHYAQVPMRTTLDGLADKLDQEYGFVPPLLEFTVSNLYRDFHEQARSVRYLGTGKMPAGFLGLGSVECHRLALKGPQADAELWVATGDLLPRKLVATFHRAGHPQLRIDFLAWNLNAPVTAAQFQFTPPAGAQKIEMWTTHQMEAAARKSAAKKH